MAAKIDAEIAARRESARRRREVVKKGLSRGYLKVLNEELILKQYENDQSNLEEEELGKLLRLDLSYQNVQSMHYQSLLKCSNLTVCNLRGCYLTNITPLQGCCNLLQLDLADNQISNLPRGDFWKCLSNLKILYLNGNTLHSLKDLHNLGHSSSLLILSLSDTPLSLDQYYRHHVVNNIYSLKALDGFVISDEEVIENWKLPLKFQAMGSNLKLPEHIPLKPISSAKEEIQQIFGLLLCMDRILAKFSPVTIIQRYTRGWLVRMKLLRYANHRIRKLVKKYLPNGTAKVKKANAAAYVVPPTTPLTNAPQRKVSFSTPENAQSAAQRHSRVSLPTRTVAAPAAKYSITESARALWIRAYPHGLNRTSYSTASNFRRKIQSLTELGEAEGVWDAKSRRRQKIIGGRKVSNRKQFVEDKLEPAVKKESISVKIKTGPDNEEEEQDTVGDEREVNKLEDTIYETKDAKVDENFGIQGVPPHILEEKVISHKEAPELLTKQHKELKAAAKAARSHTRDAGSLRHTKKSISSDHEIMRCPFRLRALKMVEKYHIQMKNLREQEQRNTDVVEHCLERKARQDSIRETLEERRRKLSEWAGHHWDLVACHAEEVEQERRMLKDQVALLRQQHQVNVQREKTCNKASIQTLQKLTLLDKCIKRAKSKAYKEVSLASMHEEVSQRQAEWSAKKEELKREDMKEQAKLIAKSRMDKKQTHKLFEKQSNDYALERRTKVLKGREKREMGIQLMEKTKEEILSEKLRDSSGAFVLQSDTIPAIGFGISRPSKLPNYLQKMSQKKTGFVEPDNFSSGLVALGSKSLPQREPVLLSLPRSCFKAPPETPFTELNSTSTI